MMICMNLVDTMTKGRDLDDIASAKKHFAFGLRKSTRDSSQFDCCNLTELRKGRPVRIHVEANLLKLREI